MPGGQIRGLDPMWIWMYKGEEEWINSRGERTDSRHAVNLRTGERMSVLQVRKIQRELQGLTPIPSKAVKAPRTGKIRSTSKVSENNGKITTYSFRTLEDAQIFIYDEQLPSMYNYFIVQTKFASSRIPGKVYESYKNGVRVPDKYASLSNYLTRDRGLDSTRWEQIYDKANEFNFNGKSRFYITAYER